MTWRRGRSPASFLAAASIEEAAPRSSVSAMAQGSSGSTQSLPAGARTHGASGHWGIHHSCIIQQSLHPPDKETVRLNIDSQTFTLSAKRDRLARSSAGESVSPIARSLECAPEMSSTTIVLYWSKLRYQASPRLAPISCTSAGISISISTPCLPGVLGNPLGESTTMQAAESGPKRTNRADSN